MRNFNDFVGKDVHDLCLSADGFRWRKIAALKVGVTMKMVTWFCQADKPVDGFESLVCLRVFVVYPKRW